MHPESGLSVWAIHPLTSHRSRRRNTKKKTELDKSMSLTRECMICMQMVMLAVVVVWQRAGTVTPIRTFVILLDRPSITHTISGIFSSSVCQTTRLSQPSWGVPWHFRKRPDAPRKFLWSGLIAVNESVTIWGHVGLIAEALDRRVLTDYLTHLRTGPHTYSPIAVPHRCLTWTKPLCTAASSLCTIRTLSSRLPSTPGVTVTAPRTQIKP